ncbi:MAG: hypothetical protein MJ214_03805 [Bacilli bacterium]|nr:hypothetical protein [Bacilli bacterium]
MSLFKRKPKIIRGHAFSEYQINRKKGRQIGFIAISSIAILTAIILPIYSCATTTKEGYQDYSFKYWNECESLNKLKTFVRETVTPGNKNYVPKIDRIATFDMDGTLFGERSPIYLEWMLYNDYYTKMSSDDHRKTDQVPVPNEFEGASPESRVGVTPEQVNDAIVEFMKSRKDSPVIDDPSHERKVSLEMGEAYVGAQLFSEIPVLDYQAMVDEYLKQDAACFNNLKYKDMFYKPMIEVVEYLQQNNFDVYVVSGTDRFMVRTIIQKHLNIPSNKIIGMDVSLYREGGNVIRGKDLKYKNVKEVKVELIAQEICNWPILSFGNSSGDVPMHDFTLSNPYYHHLAFMNVADDLEREFGYTEKELEERTRDWDRFEQFSMKKDWKTIYGDNVTIIPEPK